MQVWKDRFALASAKNELPFSKTIPATQGVWGAGAILGQVLHFLAPGPRADRHSRGVLAGHAPMARPGADLSLKTGQSHDWLLWPGACASAFSHAHPPAIFLFGPCPDKQDPVPRRAAVTLGAWRPVMRAALLSPQTPSSWVWVPAWSAGLRIHTQCQPVGSGGEGKGGGALDAWNAANEAGQRPQTKQGMPRRGAPPLLP